VNSGRRSLRYGIECRVLIISVANPNRRRRRTWETLSSDAGCCVYFMGIFSGCMSSRTLIMCRWQTGALLLPSVCYGDLLGRHGYLSSLPPRDYYTNVYRFTSWVHAHDSHTREFYIHIQKVVIMHQACMSFSPCMVDIFCLCCTVSEISIKCLNFKNVDALIFEKLCCIKYKIFQHHANFNSLKCISSKLSKDITIESYYLIIKYYRKIFLSRFKKQEIIFIE